MYRAQPVSPLSAFPAALFLLAYVAPRVGAGPGVLSSSSGLSGPPRACRTWPGMWHSTSNQVSLAISLRARPAFHERLCGGSPLRRHPRPPAPDAKLGFVLAVGALASLAAEVVSAHPGEVAGNDLTRHWGSLRQLGLCRGSIRVGPISVLPASIWQGPEASVRRRPNRCPSSRLLPVWRAVHCRRLGYPPHDVWDSVRVGMSPFGQVMCGVGYREFHVHGLLFFLGMESDFFFAYVPCMR